MSDYRTRRNEMYMRERMLRRAAGRRLFVPPTNAPISTERCPECGQITELVFDEEGAWWECRDRGCGWRVRVPEGVLSPLTPDPLRQPTM